MAAAPVLVFALALLSACRSGGGLGVSEPIDADPSQPIRLEARGPNGVGAPSVLAPLNRRLAERAIENYRINKNRAKGPYKLRGADLNGDGVAEALVLFEGKDWCKTTGCSLAIFQAAARGYKPVFRTVRVKPPVIVAHRESRGWRELIVMSGGGRAPLRRVVLRFSRQGYPRNAMLEPEVPPDRLIDGDVAIEASGGGLAPQSSSPATR